jgi:hypothetical protein
MKRVAQNVSRVMAVMLLCMMSFNASSETDEQQLKAKMNVYVEVINGLSNPIVRSYKRYLEWVNPQLGPTGREINVLGLYRIYQVTELLDKILTAKTLPPHQPEVDALVDDYVAAAMQVTDEVNVAEAYYSLGKYKEDGLDKGRVMHEPLMEAFKVFDSINTRLVSAYQQLRLAYKQQQIAQYQADGKQARVLVESALIQADALDYYVRQSNYTLLGKFELIDTNRVDAMVAEIEPVVQELGTYVADKPEEVKQEFGGDGNRLVQVYVLQLNTLVNAAKTLSAKVLGKQSFDSILSAALVEGSPENISAKYNEVAEAYNALVQ